jgi:glycosyltransferase involved in cell wall biosynthesis
MGGIPSSLELITTNLEYHGMKSTVISFGNSNASFQGAAPRITRMKESGVEVFLTNSRFTNPYGLGWNFNFSKHLRMKRDYSLIVLHQIYTLSTIHGYRFAKKHKIPFAVFPHGSLTKYHESDSKFIKYFAKILIFSRILKNANSIIVTCSGEQDDLPDYLRNKSVIIPFGVDQVSHKSRDKDDTNFSNSRIIFSGRYTKKKNLPLLLQAMQIVVRKNPDVVLDIAGTGTLSEIKDISGTIKELGIEKNVLLHGWVNKSQMVDLMNSADLLVLPSENENFALVVSEALSLGLPCVVSKYVGTSEIVSRYKAGEVIDELTPDSVASALIKVLNGDRSLLRNAAMTAAREQFDWMKIAIKWKSL